MRSLAIPTDAPTEPSRANRRARLLFAAGAGVVLVGVVVAVAFGGGEEAREPVALYRGCVEAWSDDQAALAYGRHNFNFHDYEAALVTHLDPAAEEVPADDDAALCALIFPSRVLDLEPFAAGEVLRDGAWVAISELPGVELTRVAELQAQAADFPNATIDGEGSLGEL
jgi:hypothetical protein